MSRLIGRQDTPAITALEYEEMRDWEKHPEKTGYYAELIEKRTAAENPRRKPNKKKRREKK